MAWPLLLPQEPNFSFFSNLYLGAIKKTKKPKQQQQQSIMQISKYLQK